MSSTVSYHLPDSIKKYIENSSQEQGLSRGKFLVSVIKKFAKLSQENNDLKAYLDVSADTKFLTEEMEESDIDLAVEKKYNSAICNQ